MVVLQIAVSIKKRRCFEVEIIIAPPSWKVSVVVLDCLMGQLFTNSTQPMKVMLLLVPHCLIILNCLNI